MPDPRSDPNAFALRFDPTGTAWAAAGPDVRRRFYQQVGKLAAAAKDLELARGLDRHGRRLKPIAASTRRRRRLWDYSPMGKADPDAPPLTPCHARSRTRSLLRFAAHADGVWLFWAVDPHTGRPWGEILDFHREGGGRLPVRDVIGLSEKATRQVRRDAWAWWHSAGAKAHTAAVARVASPAEAAGRPGVVGPRPKVTPFDTGWRQLKGGKFESISVKRAVTPIAGGRA
jgi:hypothetical protein